MVQITQTKTEFSKNPSTKTTYIKENEMVEIITAREYNLTVKDETLQWFRRLGGSETAVRGYTCDGYKVVRLTSVSPDKQSKTVREFKFEWIDK